MFLFFDLIMTSPVGVFIFARAQDLIFAAIVASDCDECGFNDLGKLLFGGLALALVVGVGISILFRRLKGADESDARFVSIHSTVKKTEDDSHAAA